MACYGEGVFSRFFYSWFHIFLTGLYRIIWVSELIIKDGSTAPQSANWCVAYRANYVLYRITLSNSSETRRRFQALPVVWAYYRRQTYVRLYQSCSSWRAVVSSTVATFNKVLASQGVCGDTQWLISTLCSGKKRVGCPARQIYPDTTPPVGLSRSKWR